MNSINFSQVGGFPMTTNILGKMQTATSLFNAFGNIVGDKSIISGCIVSGANTTSGVVFVNGEPFEFRGGVTQTKVLIKEETETLLFQNNNSYPVIKTRYITFGVGVGAMDWADFKAGFPTKNIDSLLTRITALEARPSVGNIPVGLIALWGQAANLIPAGWVEYTDLSGKSPVGFDSNDPDYDVVGKSGGSKNKTLSLAELPAHAFKYLKAIAGRGYRTASDDTPLSGTQETNTNTIGENKEFSIMNPYRVVHFIKYTGV